MNRKLVLSVLVMLFVGCGDPKIGAVKQPYDTQLSCQELHTAIKHLHLLQRSRENRVAAKNSEDFMGKLKLWSANTIGFVQQKRVSIVANQRQQYLESLFIQNKCGQVLAKVKLQDKWTKTPVKQMKKTASVKLKSQRHVVKNPGKTKNKTSKIQY